MLAEAPEAKEAVNPGRIIAGAVAQDGVGGKVVAQPHHDRAEIDLARLLGRLFRPGEIVGMCAAAAWPRTAPDTSRCSSAAANAVGVAWIGRCGL